MFNIDKHSRLTFGNVIFVDARCCNNILPVDLSKIKTENARCNIPRGWPISNSCDFLLLAEPITLSLSSNTNTVSFSIISVWVMALPSHAVGVVVDAIVVLENATWALLLLTTTSSSTNTRRSTPMMIVMSGRSVVYGCLLLGLCGCLSQLATTKEAFVRSERLFRSLFFRL